MRISKDTADRIATKITEPLKNKVKAAEQALIDKAVEIVTSNIPADIIDAFEKHPIYFKTNSWVYFKGVGISGTIGTSLKKALPIPSSEIKCTTTEANQVVKLNNAIETAKEKHTQTQDKIYQTLLSLGTYKRIIDQLPEVKDLLPSSTNTALILPIDDIRKQIKSLIPKAAAV